VLDPEVLRRLQGLDRIHLREAIAEVCRPFGELKRIEIYPDGKGGFMCFVDLVSLGGTAALCRGLGAFTFGHSAGFRIPATGER